ncbi:unnamed protein product [Medioppia subpectinata]|uniref:Calcium homeostasis endoplasmic reticulum protein n=1 Tax=Medioppia subpectinata TaxID=1979941 RepID=A0A7R9PZ15_9ACAR|nr:unnamed protein product [Medioppia subpectinata]CAG2105987.1 unnamed protein product [Medioppia subpectinata]
MNYPKGPEDEELRNIIDKLAQFVARNGPEFEQMTKNKQRDNPRFYFLFGGEFFNYYQYRVATEHEIHRKQQQQLCGQQIMPSGPPPGPQSQAPPQQQQNIWQNNGINNMNNTMKPIDPNVLTQQINELQEQIRQSETNLTAQHQVLMQQKQMIIDDVIRQSQDDQIRRMADEFNIDLNDFESVLLPIADNCTKESIAKGKVWIFNNCNTPVHHDVMAKYLAQRITTSGSSFESRLHLLYLINDLFNHCQRKGDDSLKRALERVIVPIFCHTFGDADDDDKQQKLTKVCLHYLMRGSQKDLLLNLTISSVTNGQLAKLTQLQKQHSEFVAHIQSNIQRLQQQKQQQMVANVSQMSVPSLPMPINPQMPGHRLLMPPNQSPLGTRPPLMGQFDHPPPQALGSRPPIVGQFDQQMPSRPNLMPQFDPQGPPPPTSVPMFLPLVHQNQPPGIQTSNSSQAPQRLLLPQLHQSPQLSVRLGPVPQIQQQIMPTNQGFPNPLSGPPFTPANHQFFNAAHNTAPIPPKEVIPDVPYFELPAGLMAPLVKLEDFDYKSIVPKDIRLPPPAPPNDRLLQAVEAFYAPPTHERPRNSDGWEQLGLYEFFKAKSQTMKIKDESPAVKDPSEEPFSDKNKNTVKNSSNNTSNNNNNTSKPNPKIRGNPGVDGVQSRRQVSDEDTLDLIPGLGVEAEVTVGVEVEAVVLFDRIGRGVEVILRSKVLRKFYIIEESVVVELNGCLLFSTYTKPDTRLDESNKGHQMLKKMGWSGTAGLGATEQGIKDPIKGGDVRENDEKYRGVGVRTAENDPFEKFRQNKGKAFLQRIAQGRSDK